MTTSVLKFLFKELFSYYKFNINLPSSVVPFNYLQRRSIYSLDPIDLKEPTFNKILVANRSEIACRIIKTAKRMGIKTVAVYSVADVQAVHVKFADEAFFIGESPASESYLNQLKIMEAVHMTQSDAVHPGYGFLSENNTFVKMLESENVAFIGPSAHSITGMGDKLESKRLAMAAGVNTIPGFDGVVVDADHCVDIARQIGYPVMIKASAGGGGKGMRIARNDDDAREGFKLSTQEALSSFGDSRMLVEKFIDNPRHIEIQVLGDKHGNVIYLNERECSIQRRNQKVIEEAPSVFLDKNTREAMGKQAVSLCKKIGYYSAGTVEFLVDEDRNFYFLEMNTRLQVEHPITECITGVDLVQQMIRVAKGHRLRIKQNDIKINGWAIESRVYAEDPYRNFGSPSIGKLYKYLEPTHLPGVRCDSGIEEGSEISVYYDPMICKLVCYGNDRQEVIERSIEALDSYVIRGVTHNIPLLRDIFVEKRFNEGDINTNYLPQVYPDGFKGLQLDENSKYKLLAMGAALYASNDLRNRNFLNHPKHKIRSTKARWELYIDLNGEISRPEVTQDNGYFDVLFEKKVFQIAKEEINFGKPVLEVNIDDDINVFQLLSKNASGDYQIIYQGTTFTLHIFSQKAAQYLHLMPKKAKSDLSKQVLSLMPGLVKSVNCNMGDMVVEGQELCVIESMKMLNSMTASMAGKIQRINIHPGDTVQHDEVLIELI